MTPEVRALIEQLEVVPGGAPPISSAEFLEEVGSADGRDLGCSLLRDAADRRDADDVELALVVCDRFGFTAEHLPILLMLSSAEWHYRHEDVAEALGVLKAPASVSALVHLATWVPDYLEYDEARALASKAIWSLGRIEGSEARLALISLTHDGDPAVSAAAEEQLQR